MRPGTFFSPSKLLKGLLLLQLEIDGPLHGYGLSSALENRYKWKPSQTAIYTTLKALEDKGAVSVDERIESGRVQKVYGLTAKGRKLLAKKKDHILAQMLQKFVHTAIFMQKFCKDDELIEMDKKTQSFKKVIPYLSQISNLAILLHSNNSSDIESILDTTVNSLKSLAKTQGVDLQNLNANIENFFENSK